jgi:hypothetical protein
VHGGSHLPAHLNPNDCAICYHKRGRASRHEAATALRYGGGPSRGGADPSLADLDYYPGQEQYHTDGIAGGSGVRWDAPVWPINVYGATKAFAEALCRVYSTSHGLSCLAVRLGGFGMGNPNRVSVGISGVDCAACFRRCVDADPELKFAVVPGISAHRKNHQVIPPPATHHPGDIPEDSLACAGPSRGLSARAGRLRAGRRLGEGDVES